MSRPSVDAVMCETGWYFCETDGVGIEDGEYPFLATGRTVCFSSGVYSGWIIYKSVVVGKFSFTDRGVFLRGSRDKGNITITRRATNEESERLEKKYGDFAKKLD